MKSKYKPVVLASYEDIFKPEGVPDPDDGEKVIEVELTELCPYQNHPFKVRATRFCI